MTPERWQQIRDLFGGVLARDPALRSSYLEEACPNDPELRQEVASLITSLESTHAFLEVPALASGLSTEEAGEEADDLTGRRIGPYAVLGLMGRGGMGAVYRAARADDVYEKVVAVKVIRRGMDSAFVLGRFRAERRILARLEHPGIAHLLDGGTTDDGRPYFVMEHVEGTHVDQYADERGLDTPARLRLFLEVCSAVAYAHRNLVVHRDLKPANILVTAEGAPKLLDFGIAKLLDPGEAGESATTSLRPMTLDYASPEQVRGEPVTTASDVYSLGMVLYELLTGRRPYRLAASQPAQALRLICEHEPERPSTAVTRPREEGAPSGEGRARHDPTTKRLRHALAGDVDTIVLMALRKEPQRRYASVEQLADDVRRHLEGRPVLARKDRFAYRAGKFVRRNRLAVAASALMVAGLLTGIVVASWQARVARAERARAERRFDEMRKLANSFLFEFHDAIARLPGSTPARQLVVTKALQNLDSLARDATGDLSLQRELATAYLRVGDVQGRPSDPNLGDLKGAISSYEKALAIRERLAATEPGHPSSRIDLAESHSRLGQVLSKGGRLAESVQHSRKAVALLEEGLKVDAANPRLRIDLLGARVSLGELLVSAGDVSNGLTQAGQAVREAEELVRARPQDVDAKLGLASAYGAVGRCLKTTGDFGGNIENQRRGLRIIESVAEADPANLAHRRRVAMAHAAIGDASLFGGRAREALAHYRKALALAEGLSAQDPSDAQAQRSVGSFQVRIALALGLMGDVAGDLQASGRAVALLEPLSAADPANRELWQDLRIAHSRIGHALLRKGDVPGGVRAHRKAMELAEALAGADPGNLDARGGLATAHYNLGKALEIQEDLPAALESHRKALAISEALAVDPANARAQERLALSHGMLADALVKAGDLSAALEHFQRARGASEALLAGDASGTAVYQEHLALWDARLGDVHALMAQRETRGAAPEHWRQAQASYRQSMQTLKKVSDRRPLSGEVAELPARITRELARCARALSTPQRTPTPGAR